MSLAESDVELAMIEFLQELGWTYLPGPVLDSERAGPASVILGGRLATALADLNPDLSSAALEDAYKQVLRLDSPVVGENNAAFHKRLTDGVDVEVRADGGMRGQKAWLVDFSDPKRNDWLVVNQLTVIEHDHRRPDLVLYLNGLPVAVIELKSPKDEYATVEGGWNQLQKYQADIPTLFHTNEICVVSDGSVTRVGSMTAGFDRFGPWRSIDGAGEAPGGMPSLEVLCRGLFDRRRLLDYLEHFVICEPGEPYVKKIAGYHQFYAVNKAVAETVRATAEAGDRRVGVMYHTTGSGKSVSMSLYAGKVIKTPALRNPTLVVVTDRNDLDGQLFGTFCAAEPLLRTAPKQAGSRDELRALLSVASGGVVFTTIQKFGLSDEERATGSRFPTLTDRRNVVVIVDEAHRTQYGFSVRIDGETGEVTQGLAQNMRDALPNASFVGFTGTPIEFEDKSTPAVFGDYIDTYTIQQAVRDGFTVPIRYEARLARIQLPEDKRPQLDDEFEEVTEGAEDAAREKLKTTWARIEALVGTEERLGLVADDLLDHWARRLEILDGKAMIVCMSRRICVDLYQQIVTRKPEWHAEDDAEGAIKVVMTGAASDPLDFHPHIRGKARLKAVEKRFKDADDKLKLVIVRDMWLTGFDVPSAHTLYVDKPMRGHGLLQAIARVNRKFKDKPAGLVVDYIGLADQLKKAVKRYGGGGGESRPGVPVELALEVLREKVDVVRAMLHGFDYAGYLSAKASERLAALTGAVDHICGLEPGDPEVGKKRFLDAAGAMNKAAGIALHLEGARDLRDEVGFFQSVARNIQKYTVSGPASDADMNAAIRQIVAGAIASQGVVDVFGEAGLDRPDISILSDEFLQSVADSEQKNLQLELLKKLLNDEIRRQGRRNVVLARKFSDMLAATLLRYQNRTIETAQVIVELIEMAKSLRDAPKRGEALGLGEDEMCFYDALADHGDVREVMGDATLAAIAHDLVESIRRSVTIDWTQKETVRADIRRKVKRLLRRHGYPPDKRKSAIALVLKQAETVARDWAVSPITLPYAAALQVIEADWGAESHVRAVFDATLACLRERGTAQVTVSALAERIPGSSRRSLLDALFYLASERAALMQVSLLLDGEHQPLAGLRPLVEQAPDGLSPEHERLLTDGLVAFTPEPAMRRAAMRRIR